MRAVRHGNRGELFSNKVRDICTMAGLSQRVTAMLVHPSSLEILGQALTHPTADSENNYEVLELLGDASYNTAVVYYTARRFAHIAQKSIGTAVKVLARLKINLTSKTTLVEVGRQLGLMLFVSADESVLASSPHKLLEDTTEAFMGAITLLVDNEICIGAGYGAVYRIVHTVFEKMHIDLKYEALFDARTRLKEVLDAHKDLGTVNFVYTNSDSAQEVEATVLLKSPGVEDPICIGVGHGETRSLAMQNASEQALHTLKYAYNAFKPVPSEYISL